MLSAVNQGRKITAIKLLREERGLDLKEAKQAIDRLERARRGDAVDYPALRYPPGMRWIPKGMTIRYLAKAETGVTATAALPAISAGESHVVKAGKSSGKLRQPE